MANRQSTEEIELRGDEHTSNTVDTPIRADAFLKSDEKKIETIEWHFSKIMEELGLDMKDDSLSGLRYMGDLWKILGATLFKVSN